MPDNLKIAHDLTLLIISKADNTPETIVNSYYETLTIVKAHLTEYQKTHTKKAIIPDRSQLNL